MTRYLKGVFNQLLAFKSEIMHHIRQTVRINEYEFSSIYMVHVTNRLTKTEEAKNLVACHKMWYKIFKSKILIFLLSGAILTNFFFVTLIVIIKTRFSRDLK